ncbi:MAG: nucleotide sugar dehydrogenase [Candidatus Hodarchaeota archaeon]
MNPQTKICVIGAAGYIGLPLAAFLAKAGYYVIGVDVNSAKINKLSKGICTLDEKGMDKLFRDAFESKRLIFTDKPEPAEIFIIAVPTPLNADTNTADLEYIETALTSTIPLLRKGNLIILESTIPPFTCRNVVKNRVEEETQFGVPHDIMVAHCPERGYPGNLVYEFVHNDRIIGGMSLESTKSAVTVYKSFVKGAIRETNDVTAEIVKLAENSFRDVNIAYANELKLITDRLNIDVEEVIELANLHPRVNILKPGIGVGGHCISIDPWFLWESAPDVSKIIPMAREINNLMPEVTAKEIYSHVKGISSPKILILGKSYKPDVTDIRESPALYVVEILRGMSSQILIKFIDPLVDDLKSFSLEEEVKGMDLLVILVPHTMILQQLRNNYDSILKALKTPKILQY